MTMMTTTTTPAGLAPLPLALTVICLLGSGALTAAEPRELIGDRHFQQGFNVHDPKPGKLVPRGHLTWDASQTKPTWNLAQWSSKHSIAGAKPEKLPSGAVRFSNPAKTILAAPLGSEHAELVLGVNARLEYAGRARRKGEQWPHLLVSQRFSYKPAISDLKQVPFRVAVRLQHSTLHRTPDYTPRLHAAQFQVFINIQNLNRKSSGYGDFLYFGIPLYDSRWRVPRPFAQPDAAGKFIFTPSGDRYTTESAHDGRWVTVDLDLLPLMLEGLQRAWKRGFLTDSRDLRDYHIAAMNMGWEVPGILNVAIQVRDLSLKTVLAD